MYLIVFLYCSFLYNLLKKNIVFVKVSDFQFLMELEALGYLRQNWSIFVKYLPGGTHIDTRMCV